MDAYELLKRKYPDQAMFVDPLKRYRKSELVEHCLLLEKEFKAMFLSADLSELTPDGIKIRQRIDSNG